MDGCADAFGFQKIVFRSQHFLIATQRVRPIRIGQSRLEAARIEMRQPRVERVTFRIEVGKWFELRVHGKPHEVRVTVNPTAAIRSTAA